MSEEQNNPPEQDENEVSENESQKLPEEKIDESVTLFFGTDPIQMMRNLGRRPSDKQLKEFEQQEKNMAKKKDQDKENKPNQ